MSDLHFRKRLINKRIDEMVVEIRKNSEFINYFIKDINKLVSEMEDKRKELDKINREILEQKNYDEIKN